MYSIIWNFPSFYLSVWRLLRKMWFSQLLFKINSWLLCVKISCIIVHPVNPSVVSNALKDIKFTKEFMIYSAATKDSVLIFFLGDWIVIKIHLIVEITYSMIYFVCLSVCKATLIFDFYMKGVTSEVDSFIKLA